VLRGEDTLAKRMRQVAQAAKAAGRLSRFGQKRRSRSPNRAASIARRRVLAASGVMPPAIAAKFTVSEQAVLRIVSPQWRAWLARGKSPARIRADLEDLKKALAPRGEGPKR
jgi:hypothetical protein